MNYTYDGDEVLKYRSAVSKCMDLLRSVPTEGTGAITGLGEEIKAIIDDLNELDVFLDRCIWDTVEVV